MRNVDSSALHRHAVTLTLLLASSHAVAAEGDAAADKKQIEPVDSGLTVERLPGSAYPAWKTRGLKGGSLWLTLHGMPWPYYPKTGVGISGSVWVDFGYETIKRGDPTQS